MWVVGVGLGFGKDVPKGNMHELQFSCIYNMSSIRKNARKVVCIGRNYAYALISTYIRTRTARLTEPHPGRDHIAELNNVRPKQPFFFLKPSSSILPRSHGPVLRPKGVTLHYEVELAVIIGKQIRNLDPEDEQGAMDAIHG